MGFNVGSGRVDTTCETIEQLSDKLARNRRQAARPGRVTQEVGTLPTSRYLRRLGQFSRREQPSALVPNGSPAELLYRVGR
jgi:hypothetical protein